MNIIDPISSLLFGRVRLAVLGALVEDPGRNFYMRELAAHINMVPGAIQRELKVQVEAGLITRHRRGRQVYYQANVDCVVFNDIRNLLTKTAGIAGAVRRALAPLSSKVTYAAIYGSLASGQLTPRSVVDLLIVGDLSMADVMAVLQPIEDLTGREINPSIYSLQECELQLAEPDSFLSTALRATLIDLIGDLREPDSVGTGRLDSPGHTKSQEGTQTPGASRKKPPERRGSRDR